jgi:hypothetical protein
LNAPKPIGLTMKPVRPSARRVMFAGSLNLVFLLERSGGAFDAAFQLV